MIINIRGTGGAGKSTIVRSLMKRFPTVTPFYIEGRKRPLGYRCSDAIHKVMSVVGHYETPCGGGDTMPSPVAVFDLVAEEAAAYRNVVFEGIISQDSNGRLIELAKQFVDVTVIALDVPLQVCLDSIRKRRDERGDMRPLNPENTITREHRMKGGLKKLHEAGIHTMFVSREVALAYCVKVLDLGAEIEAEEPEHEFRLT